MRKYLLLILTAIAGLTASAATTVDMINLSQFPGYTPGSTIWFTTPRTFNTEATYAGNLAAAKDDSGLSFTKNNDYFYVNSPVPEARIKQINVQFLTEGELYFYMSETKKSISGGAYESVTASNPILNLNGDYGYFILRCPAGGDCIVSAITITWELQGQATLDLPTVLVDDEPFDTAEPLDLDGVAKRIGFAHAEAGAEIFYMWEPDQPDGMPVFRAYTEPLTIKKTGTLSYYAEFDGLESELGVLKIVGTEVAPPAAPVVTVEGIAVDPSQPLDLDGQPKRVILTSDDPDVTIYQLWIPAVVDEPGTDTEALGETEYTVHPAEGFLIETKGTLSFYAEKDGDRSETVSIEVVDTFTAIDLIEADPEARDEWFDLHGVRVDRPSNGVYILRSGDKTVKVVR
ncbi:MAG: hypothetical protein NC336_06385 [Clostridium sp.]|nr:hypothetical protein [Clostridium sp.]